MLLSAGAAIEDERGDIKVKQDTIIVVWLAGKFRKRRNWSDCDILPISFGGSNSLDLWDHLVRPKLPGVELVEVLHT